MDKLRLRIWRLIYSPQTVSQKQQRLVTKRIARLIKGASGAGTEAMTFWEKVQVCCLLFIMIGFTVGLIVALIYASSMQ